MSSMPEGWQDPKTNWSPEDPVGPGDLTRIERNAQAIELGDRTVDPAQAPAGNIGTLGQILSWIANRIKAITGGANWWSTPATTLAGAKGHMDAAAPHSGHATTGALSSHANASAPHSGHATTGALSNHTGAKITTANTVHGIRQGSGNGLDADRLDGGHWVIAAHDTITVAAWHNVDIVPSAPYPCWYQVDVRLPKAPSTAVYAHQALNSVPDGAAGWQTFRYGNCIRLRLTNRTDGKLTIEYVVRVWSEA